eukprot:gene1128-5520_t
MFATLSGHSYFNPRVTDALARAARGRTVGAKADCVLWWIVCQHDYYLRDLNQKLKPFFLGEVGTLWLNEFLTKRQSSGGPRAGGRHLITEYDYACDVILDIVTKNTVNTAPLVKDLFEYEQTLKSRPKRFRELPQFT